LTLNIKREVKMERKIASAFKRLTGVEAERPEAVAYDGKKWIIGEEGKDCEYPLGITDLEYYYPLVAKWIFTHEVEHPKEKKIVISLPTETWWKEASTGKFELIKRLKEKIKTETGADVDVLPQGLSAIPALKGLEKGKRTLVIDGGFNTINIGLIDERGKPIFVRSWYNEFGIRDFLENYFRPKLAKKFPAVSSNLQLLKQVFLTGKVDMGFEEVSVMGEKREAMKEFLEALFGKIKSELERQSLTFSQFAIVGGIAHYIDGVKTNKKYAMGDEFSTVVGMRIIGQKRFGKDVVAVDFGFGDIKVSAEKLKEKPGTVLSFW
jgi:hypothetical protein